MNLIAEGDLCAFGALGLAIFFWKMVKKNSSQSCQKNAC
jgi:hypothetical protein